MDLKIRTGYVINILIIVMMAIISFTPIISRNQPVYWMPALFMLWCFSAFSIKTIDFNIQPSGPLFWLMMMMGWRVFLSIIGINDTNLWGHLAVIPVYGIVLVVFFVLKNYRYKEKVLLTVLLCVIFVANVLHNDYIAFGHPEMFLTLNNNIIQALSTNLGSTPMVVSCLFFFPVMLFLLTEKDMKKFRTVAILLLAIIGYYFFYLNSRGIAFFLSLFMVWEFLIASRYAKKRHRLGYYILLSLGILIIYEIALAPLINGLLSIFSNNSNLVERFSEIQDFSTYGESEGSLSGRMFLYSLSINTWLSSLENFIFGVGVHDYDKSYFGYIASGVGHHSEFLDTLAYYGVVGGFLLYKLLSVTFVFIIKRMRSVELYNKYLAVIVVFVLHGVLNNVLNSMDCVMMEFLIIPLIFDVLNDKKYELVA